MSFELPPPARGTAEQQLAALRDYLVRLAQDLEPDTGASVRSAGRESVQNGKGAQSEKDARELWAQTNALRAMIIKNAKLQAADKAALEQSIENVEGTTLLHIDSSRGTVFKHSTVSTVLRVVLFRGGERITDADAMRAAFGSGAHLQWSYQRTDEDRFGILSASDSRLSEEGFCLTLTPQDVDVKVTFACRLVVE